MHSNTAVVRRHAGKRLYEMKKGLALLSGVGLLFCLYVYGRSAPKIEPVLYAVQSNNVSSSFRPPAWTPAWTTVFQPKRTRFTSRRTIQDDRYTTVSRMISSSAKLHESGPILPDSKCHLKSSGRGVQNGRWFDFSANGMRLYAYSALVDDRPSLESDPVVRVVALADIMEEMIKIPALSCRYYYFRDSNNNTLIDHVALDENKLKIKIEDFTTIIVDLAMEMSPIRNIGMGWPINSKNAREYILTCLIPSIAQLRASSKSKNTLDLKNLQSQSPFPLPQALGILIGTDNHDSVTSCVPVERPARPAKKKEFILCVQVAFGKIDPVRLVEWLELQSILGIESVGIYDQEIHEPAMIVLRHYAEKGIVDLRRSDIIPYSDRQYMLHGSPVINDCMYRNIHSSNYIMVYDIDETILPKLQNFSADSYPFKILIEKLQERYGNGVHEYSFRNEYFFTDLPADSSKPSEYTFLKHNMAALSPPGYSIKSIIHSSSCIQMHNHYCWGNTKSFNRKQVQVDFSFATNQHYKKCHFSASECSSLFGNSTKQETILTYKRDLIDRVERKVKEIRQWVKDLKLSDPFAGHFQNI